MIVALDLEDKYKEILYVNTNEKSNLWLLYIKNKRFNSYTNTTDITFLALDETIKQAMKKNINDAWKKI